MHAEATSEKQAMGWYLDGRVTAVVGTHTHVATADERVLPSGTALHHRRGHDRAARLDHRHGTRPPIIKRFLDGMPARFEVATGNIQMNAVLLIDADPDTGRAQSIERRRYHIGTLKSPLFSAANSLAFSPFFSVFVREISAPVEILCTSCAACVAAFVEFLLAALSHFEDNRLASDRSTAEAGNPRSVASGT